MDWVGRLISFALVLQTLEFMRIRPFAWTTIEPEIPRVLRPFVQHYSALLYVRLICALLALLFPHAAFAMVLLLTTWLIAVRWRGTFNGGSDSMAIQILIAWSVCLCFPSSAKACVYYIAIQTVLSYAVAGFAKLKQPAWRNGTALSRFTQAYSRVPHESPANLGAVAIQRAPAIWAWIVIAFECSFPLAMLNPSLCLVYIAGGIAFHFVNFYVFGLNRFFFTWMAAYPALYIVSL